MGRQGQPEEGRPERRGPGDEHVRRPAVEGGDQHHAHQAFRLRRGHPQRERPPERLAQDGVRLPSRQPGPHQRLEVRRSRGSGPADTARAGSRARRSPPRGTARRGWCSRRARGAGTGGGGAASVTRRSSQKKNRSGHAPRPLQDGGPPHDRVERLLRHRRVEPRLRRARPSRRGAGSSRHPGLEEGPRRTFVAGRPPRPPPREPPLRAGRRPPGRPWRLRRARRIRPPGASPRRRGRETRWCAGRSSRFPCFRAVL